MIEARLKSSAQSKEVGNHLELVLKCFKDATNILGDKLHQKMDSIAFTQVGSVAELDP